MNKPTPGPLRVSFNERGDLVIGFDSPIKMTLLEWIRLISASVSSCVAVNPDNPLAVAEALPSLVWVLRNLENDDGSIPSTIWNVRNAALAKLEGKL